MVINRQMLSTYTYQTQSDHCSASTIASHLRRSTRGPGVVNIEFAMVTTWVAADIEFTRTCVVCGEGGTSIKNTPRRVYVASQIESGNFTACGEVIIAFTGPSVAILAQVFVKC